MRISELARRSNTPLATVKFYLREGLLPAGARTSATQALYNESHVWRLRVVRVLVDYAGLSLAQVRQVLNALEDDEIAAAAAKAHASLAPDAPEVDTAAAVDLLTELGWLHHSGSGAVAQLAQGLDAVSSLGLSMPEELLVAYAQAARDVAEADVHLLPTPPPHDAVTRVVLGTVLFEPILLALRRCAQVDVSSRAWPDSAGESARPQSHAGDA
ncbi:MAG: MerR family transcriptional regulator [Actinomycetales bacterium]